MNDLVNNNENEDGKISLENYEYDANRLTMINDNMYHQVGLHNRNVRNFENSNNRYWNAQIDYNQIMNNERVRYDFFSQKAYSITSDINKPNQLIRLWRYGNLYYYRPSPFSDMIVGDKEKISKEISSRYSNVNIVFVDDLNNALSYKNAEIRVDTTYIADNSIPVVDENVFDSTRIDEVFVNLQGLFSRNHLRYTSYLLNRFYDFDLKNEPQSYAKHVIQKITNLKDLKFLASRLGKFFKHLNSSNAIILVGNKDVSEGVLLNRILKPIFGSQFCTTITDEMLQTVSMEEIIKHKLIYHIDHIPTSETDREKLREILISILVDKFIMIENKFVPIHGQVFITIDEADPFLKDFLSSSDVFFVNSMKNIMTNLQEEDKISFHKKLYSSLTTFSKELSVLGNMPESSSIQNNTNNQEFIKLLDDIDGNIVKLIEDNILDPFSSNFENLIPMIERFKHTHVTGVTGSGKSELLKALIMVDILRADGSVILLEPHGDLAQSVIKLIKDKTRLIYINPFLNEGMTPTLNIFYLPNKSEANIARLTQVILNVLKGVNADEKFTGAMEDVLEMCIRVLLRKGGGSFQELYRFLNDNRNENLVQFGINSPNILESEFYELMLR